MFKKHCRHELGPIHGRIPLPLLLLALRRWLSLPSSDFSISSRSPIRLCQGLLADHLHACSRKYHKLYFFGGYCGCGRQNPLIGGRKECSFLFLSGLKDFPGKFPRITAGASLLSCSLSSRSVLKFLSVGTSLMKNFDLYFPKRRTFFFSDVCLSQCSLCESYSSHWFQPLFCPS